MTYGLFLIIFLVVPIIVLGWALRKTLRRRQLIWVGALVAVALIYTTPWDNYLVATKVWWYDPSRVLGIRFGWVPFEEYLFFVLQPILLSLWALAIDRRLENPVEVEKARPSLRWAMLAIGGLVWISGAVILISGWTSGTYLALELVWAFPPILLQLLAGASVLWARRRVILLTIVSATFYLSIADALAISSGVWLISPQQSLGIELAGILPLEELVFFLLTNTLLVFSIHLLLAWEYSPESFKRSISHILHQLTQLSFRLPKRKHIDG